jgi:virulence factor Mce-like protein
MRGGRAQSIATSPTMVGGITTLIAVVAVFLAYNASQGLPFVPVYRVSVLMPNAERLAPNNEVRIGGSRVGVVESIEPVAIPRSGRVAAKLNLKLDQSAEPLPEGTEARVRYKSSFGLKYLELERHAGPPLAEGGTIPLSQSSEQIEFDDIANTFDTRTRAASRQVLAGFGNAFAARGSSLNEAIRNLNPLFAHLRPVAQTLVAPDTRLRHFFPALARTARIVAPVAEEQAELFTNLAASFEALSADTEALKETITTAVPTLEQGTVSLREQTPFLADFADLSARLRPGVQALRAALPDLNDALEVGAPTLARTPPINAELGRTFTALERLVEQRQTKTTLLRLRETFAQAKPLAEHVTPAQTVCNYWNYMWYALWEHISQRDQVGFLERVYPVLFPPGEGSPGGYSGIQANGRNAVTGEFEPDELPIRHGHDYGPAIDSQGRADCEDGQTGYPLGDARMPGQAASNPAFQVDHIPGLSGPTFTGRSRLPEHLQPRSLP